MTLLNQQCQLLVSNIKKRDRKHKEKNDQVDDILFNDQKTKESTFESLKALPPEERKRIERKREYKRKLRELWERNKDRYVLFYQTHIFKRIEVYTLISFRIMLRKEKKIKQVNQKALANQNSYAKKHNEVERVIGIDQKAKKVELKVKEILRKKINPKAKVKRSVQNNILSKIKR